MFQVRYIGMWYMVLLHLTGMSMLTVIMPMLFLLSQILYGGIGDTVTHIMVSITDGIILTIQAFMEVIRIIGVDGIIITIILTMAMAVILIMAIILITDGMEVPATITETRFTETITVQVAVDVQVLPVTV